MGSAACLLFDRATGATSATATADARIASLATDGAGVFGGTAGTPFRWDGAALTHDANLGVSDARAVGRTAEGFWSAADSSAPVVGFSNGAALATTLVGTFGDAVDVVARPGGGVRVVGGPDSYAWAASFDSSGALLGYTQTFVGVTQAVGGPGTAYAWAGFRDLGLILFADADFTQLSIPGGEDLSALAIDPDGAWLVTAHPDGTLRRWSCVP